MIEDRAGEAGAAWRELFEVSPDLQPSDAWPFALRKIREIAEFEPREIDSAPRRFGKVDAGESHSFVFIRRIAPPCVPGVLALRCEGEKIFLVVFWFFGGRLVAQCRLVHHAWFPGGYKISGKSLLLKIAVS